MYKVFLVDDEREVRKQLIQTIEQEAEGFVVCGDAGDGEQALPYILAERPDILITDIKMPFMDGLELGRIVRKELPELTLIFLTGYNEFEYARQGLRMGASDYVLKPVTPVKLVQILYSAAKQLDDIRDEKKKEKALLQETDVMAEMEGILFDNSRGEIDRDSIENFLRLSDLDEISDFVQKLTRISREISGGSKLHMMYCLYDIILTVNKAADRMGIAIPEERNMEKRTARLRSGEDFAEVLEEYFRKVMELRENMADTKTRLVLKAKEYVDTHYSESSLSLASAAEAVGVTANYLSTLFGKETGETFSEYLNKIRMRQAISYLKTTSLSFNEIAVRIGYSDGYYFSKIFKKTFGISPREFKKM